MSKLRFVNQAFSFFSIFSLMFAAAAPAAAQMSQNTMAQLRVMGNAAGGESPSITINGSNAVNASSLVSPAQITVPAGTTASLDFGSAGQIELSSGTIANLTFDATNVSIDLSEGRLRINSLPNVNFSIKTVDGTIANDKTRSAVFITEIVGGATGVNTEIGAATVNGVPVRAGQTWTADPVKKAALAGKPIKDNKGSGKFKKLLIFTGIAVGAGIAIGLAVRSGNSN